MPPFLKTQGKSCTQPSGSHHDDDDDNDNGDNGAYEEDNDNDDVGMNLAKANSLPTRGAARTPLVNDETVEGKVSEEEFPGF